MAILGIGRPTEDLAGKRYGMLTVLEQVKGNGSNAQWLCRCDCGEEIVARGTRLKYSRKRSCSNHRLPPGVSPANVLYAQYKRSAKKKGLAFELSREEFLLLTKKNCHYCDQQPAQITRGYKGDVYIYNGVDRVDNEKGYIEENVVPCCKTCNRAKRTMPVEEFLAWIARVATHQGMFSGNQ